MKWTRGYRSGDVLDRRGQGPVRPGMGALGSILPLAGRFGWKGILVVVVLMLIFSRGFFRGQSSEAPPPPTDDEAASFVGYVLDDAQKSWEAIFAKAGRDYDPARLVLFSGETETTCGYGTTAVGPFYCPRDQRVYIDLSFYQVLRERFGAPGDFAQAYVIAHEIGHHVQHQLGLLREGEGGVETELQADCFAGIWARAAKERELLEPGDIEEAIGAAAAVGDDTMQRRGGGRVRPEKFTHGSAEQRTRWFKRGYQSGEMSACDTSRGI